MSGETRTKKIWKETKEEVQEKRREVEELDEIRAKNTREWEERRLINGRAIRSKGQELHSGE